MFTNMWTTNGIIKHKLKLFQNPDVSSKSLQVVEFQMVPFQDCKKNYTKYNDPDIIVVDGMICADTIDKKGTCIVSMFNKNISLIT